MSSTYCYDDEIVPVLPHVPVLDLGNIPAARQLLSDLTDWLLKYQPSPGVQLTEHIAPGLDGAPDVALFVLAPAVETEANRPALLWFHGGGFVLGDARESLPFLERVVKDTGTVAVSVQYRLAPETVFPGPVDDGRAALDWLVEHAPGLHIDVGKIAVGGQSAGGALAAGLALQVRDEHGPKLAFQLLDIPVIDDRNVTVSAQSFVDTPVWNHRNAELSWKAYLGECNDTVSPYAAPGRAESLAGLPPTFITVNQYDPLRDEGIDYARRLAQANVRTELHLYPGTFHGSSGIALGAAVSIRQDADLRRAIGRAFGINH
ncbi:TPA: alpha/beta hydrolase [Serratia marcescens]|uniref:alpha/beta hydrolase n=1 Tax=Serratia nevei TaxID=2703794 RepID=UPI00313D9973